MPSDAARSISKRPLTEDLSDVGIVVVVLVLVSVAVLDAVKPLPRPSEKLSR